MHASDLFFIVLIALAIVAAVGRWFVIRHEFDLSPSKQRRDMSVRQPTLDDDDGERDDTPAGAAPPVHPSRA